MSGKRKRNLPQVHEVMEDSRRDRDELPGYATWTNLPSPQSQHDTQLSPSSNKGSRSLKFPSNPVSAPGRVLGRIWGHYLRALPYPIILTIVILTVSLLSSPVLCASPDDEELVCQKGVTGFPGATFPKGDILVKAGDTLEVYCRLDLTKSKGYNASFIKFIFTKTDIPREAMKTKVINETTALLRVEKMNMSSPHLSCEIAPPGAQREQFTQVCQNDIKVGHTPLPVEDFRCIAQDWRSLNCTWKKPYNPIPTNYVVQMLTKKTYLPIMHCPSTTATATSCVWGPRTEPFYMPNLNPLHLRVNGTNVLKPNGVIWDIDIDHWSIVVPGKPMNIQQRNISSTNVTISWMFELYRDLVPGLYHQVRVCIHEAPEVPCNSTILKSSKEVHLMEYNLPLQYAYVNYTVEVRMRSQRAKNETVFWSQPTTIVVISGPKIPELSPRVDIGSYESVSTTLEKRDIFIYWEDVPRLRQNGADFHYIFTIYEDGEMKTDILPKEITRSYAKFSGLWMMKSYRFLIKSANSVGNSSSTSEMFVPKNNKAPAQPRSVSKLDFTNGSFEVSWHKPMSDTPIVSYTIFRCSSSKPRPYQCQGLVEWDVVSSVKQTRKIYDYLPHPNHQIYQFAVSTNSDNMSSGMVWASCSLIHNKVPEKLKKVEKTSEEEKEIHIEWQLDCSYQPGVIEGFKITYCLVERAKAERCIDDENSEAVQGADKTTYHLKKLKSFSTYMIAVSVITLAGESQKSDPIYATTKESAPSTPQIGKVEKVTNTSATIILQPPNTLNGILQKYKISYRSVNDLEEPRQLIVPVNLTSNNQLDSMYIEGIIQKLASNANYSYTVSACTVRCSEESEPDYFITKIGYTNFKTYPSLVMSSGSLVLEWKRPEYLGGPIKSFEILIRQDGLVKEAEIEAVEFQDDIVNYQKELKFSCETDTNLTAQVRAVTELETGELINGEWSPPGNFNCAGGASWIMWMIVVIAAILTIAVIVIGSTKVYQYVKQMKEFDVKLPPGLAVQDLNGFYPKRTRKNSDGDTQSFGKENLTYQLQMTSTNHSDESKDFLPLTESILRENKPEFPYERDTSFPENYDTSHIGVWDSSLGPLSATGSPYPHAGIKIEHTSIAETDHSSHLPINDEESVDKRTSPSPTERLLDDSSTTEEDYSPQGHLQLISHSQHQPNYNVVDSIVLGNGSTFIHNPLDADNAHNIDYLTTKVPQSLLEKSFNPQHPTASQSFNSDRASSNKTSPNVPDVLHPSSRFPNSGSNSVNVNLPPPPSSSYVTWTQLGLDCKNGDTSIGIGDNARRSPYCQVGILLDSN